MSSSRQKYQILVKSTVEFPSGSGELVKSRSSEDLDSDVELANDVQDWGGVARGSDKCYRLFAVLID